MIGVFDKLRKLDFSPKGRVVKIGVLHGVTVVYGMFEAIRQFIEKEQPINEADVVYFLIHISFHLFLIATLIMGAVAGNPLFLLPWLVVTFPVFAFVSYYIFKYSRPSYITQFIFNILFVSLAWYCWFTVFQFCRRCKSTKQRTENVKILTVQ